MARPRKDSETEILEIEVFGEVLSTLRQNACISKRELAAHLGVKEDRIRNVEASYSDLPPEPTLRKWLTYLGCHRSLKTMLLTAERFRLSQTIRLQKSRPENSDISRLIQAYKDDTLTEYDKALLRCIAR